MKRKMMTRAQLEQSLEGSSLDTTDTASLATPTIRPPIPSPLVLPIPPIPYSVAVGFGMLTDTLTGCHPLDNTITAFVTLPSDHSRPIWCIRISSTSTLWLSGPGYVVTWNLGAALYNIVKQTHFVRGEFIRHTVRLVKVD